MSQEIIDCINCENLMALNVKEHSKNTRLTALYVV